MSDQTEQPDWGRLPHDPEGFFGLEAGFDRKALKRAYNRLIRKYKPERHPAEFQQIRAAYETLDSELRYSGGQRTPRIDMSGYNWGGSEEPRTTAEARGESPLSEQIVSNGIGPTYQKLRQQEEKSPRDFFALAVIGETGKQADAQTFLKWVLAGLTEHPSDPGLTALLHFWLRENADKVNLCQVLVSVSKAVRTDAFYSLTEPLWERLLTEGEFSAFRETLEQCESNLMDYRADARLAFYLHMLRPALFRADTAWIDARFDLLDERAADMPWHMEQDVVLLELLRNYVAQRQTIIADNPMRRRMDRAIESFCVDDEVTFDRAFVSLSVDIAGNPDLALDAFPAEDEGAGALMDVWLWLSADVAERNGRDERERDYDKLARVAGRTALQLVKDAESVRHFSWTILVGILSTIALGGVYGIAFTALLMGVLGVFGGEALPAALVVGVVGGGLCGFFLSERVSNFIVERYATRLARRDYRRRWRSQTVNSLVRSRLATHELLQGFGMLTRAEDDFVVDQLLFVSIYEDVGLQLVVDSQKYLV